MASAGLVEKLHSLTAGASDAELENYKLLLGIAAGGLAPDGHFPTDGVKANAFTTVLHCLDRLQQTGILYRGRPDFMTDELLASLQAEAEARRKDAIQHDRYFLGYGGPVADKLSRSSELIAFVDSYEKGMRPTGVASYLFYDREGCGLAPHIDTETFTLNAIMMLKQTWEVDPPSALVVFSPDQEPERVYMQPGEICLLRAGGTIHAREDIKPNETVHLVTIGFEPAD